MQKEGWESLVLVPHAKGLSRNGELEGVCFRRFLYAPPFLEQLAYGGGMLGNVRERPWRWLLLPVYMLALLLSAAGALSRSRVSVIHAHWVIPQGMIAVLLKRLFFWRRVRVVVTAHGGDLHADMGRIARLLLRWTLRHTDALAVVSQDMRRVAISLGVPSSRVVVASMGVDTTHFCPPPGASEREGVVSVGRLVEKKGVTYLLEAFALLLKSRPRLSLTIVGDGPLRRQLEQQAVALGIEHAVRFAGAHAPREIPHFMRRAALFVMPSIVADTGDQEGLGLVAAEAMSCGCPVVAHDIAAIRDLVLSGRTGLMVTPKNVPELSSAMARLLDDKELASQLSLAARQHVDRFYSWSSVAARYSRLYAGAVGQSVLPEQGGSSGI